MALVTTWDEMEALFRQESTSYRTGDYLFGLHNDTRLQEGQSLTAETPITTPSENDGNPDEAGPSAGRKKRRLLPTDDSSVGSETWKNVHKDEQDSSEEATTTTTDTFTEAMEEEYEKRKLWREKMCEWAYNVVDHFDLNRETVSIAMNFVDRYFRGIASPDQIDKTTFQLVSMTCLYLAIKLNEFQHIQVSSSTSTMETILHLSRSMFSLEQMKLAELEVLHRLQWHMNPPTPQVFIHQFLSASSDAADAAAADGDHFGSSSSTPGYSFSTGATSPEEYEILDAAIFMAELSAMDYFFVSYRPSEVAIAALLNAAEQLRLHDHSSSPTSTSDSNYFYYYHMEEGEGSYNRDDNNNRNGHDLTVHDYHYHNSASRLAACSRIRRLINTLETIQSVRVGQCRDRLRVLSLNSSATTTTTNTATAASDDNDGNDNDDNQGSSGSGSGEDDSNDGEASRRSSSSPVSVAAALSSSA